MPVAMRLPTPYAKKPARKRTPTIRAVRRTLESGRTTGGEVEWLEAGIASRRKTAMVSHPVRKCDGLRRKWMVPGSCQRRDDYYQNHPIPTHLIGSVKASYEPACCCTRLGVGSPLPLLSRKQNCVITLVVPRLRRTWFRGESGRARCATAQSTDGGRSTPVMPPPSVRTR